MDNGSTRLIALGLLPGNFGMSITGESSCRDVLKARLDKTFADRMTANALTSGAECQEVGDRCEDEMERQQHASLPSLGRFEAKFKSGSFQSSA